MKERKRREGKLKFHASAEDRARLSEFSPDCRLRLTIDRPRGCASASLIFPTGEPSGADAIALFPPDDEVVLSSDCVFARRRDSRRFSRALTKKQPRRAIT